MSASGFFLCFLWGKKHRTRTTPSKISSRLTSSMEFITPFIIFSKQEHDPAILQVENLSVCFFRRYTADRFFFVLIRTKCDIFLGSPLINSKKAKRWGETNPSLQDERQTLRFQPRNILQCCLLHARKLGIQG